MVRTTSGQHVIILTHWYRIQDTMF
ncbi:hypothetical protein RHECNPAF_6420098 [Rhizobium etli CNPAF512]|nr:hypothetical protein RHECNPAF_6420098 [Rhizobium etli CNPAF512]